MAPTNGRSFAIMELMERSKEPSGHGAMSMMGGDSEEISHEHCEKGLATARAFLDNEENAESPLRPKVEALASAYEDLLSSLDEDGEDKEDPEDY
jgi:hypothetical protein